MTAISKECRVCNKEFTPINNKQILCGSRECKLKRRQQTSNTPERKEQRHSYYLSNKLNWKGNHGLTRREAIEFTKEKVCEICGTTERLIPDHCHTTGIIRGVLCGQCNTAIGLLGDNFDGVKKAYNYLIRFRD